MATSETTKVVRRELERACKDFAARVESLSFLRTKKMFWTRRHPLTVDFIHFHRGGISYGAPINYSVDIRIHLGIRVLNHALDFAALNGPHSNEARFINHRYHLRFNAKTGSTYDRCVDDLVRFVEEQGVPWFQRFADLDELLTTSDSPLESEEKEFLEAARAGHANPENEAVSLKILGIKSKTQK